MFEVLIGFHIITAFSIIGLILLQQGKGATAGASFGSGASATVFGSQGSSNFLSRTTAILVAVFFVINLSLSALTYKQIKQADILLAPVKKSQPQPNNEVPE